MFEDRYVCTHCGVTMRTPKKVSDMGVGVFMKIGKIKVCADRKSVV